MVCVIISIPSIVVGVLTHSLHFSFLFFLIQITATCISRWLETGTVATHLPLKGLHTCGQVPELHTVFPKDVYALK